MLNRMIGSARRIKFLVLRIAARFCYAWAYIPVFSDAWVRFCLNKTPVLVISLPRSGSSWIGARLALSSKAAYLREPINTSYLSMGGRNTLKKFSPDSSDFLFSGLSIKAFLCAPRLKLE